MARELGKCSDFLILRCAAVRKPDAVWRVFGAPNTRQSLGPIAGLMFVALMFVALIGIAPRLFDPPPGELVLAIDAFGVHLEQHGDALQVSRSSAERTSVRPSAPPDYDESSARRDRQAAAAVIALSASRMSLMSPAVAAQCKGIRARAPGSQRCSSRVSGSGAVLS